MAASLLTVLAFIIGLALIVTAVWARYGSPWAMALAGLFLAAGAVVYEANPPGSE